MKIEIDECDGTTNVFLTAETVEDVTKLARLKMNALKRPTEIVVRLEQAGTCTAYMTFGTAIQTRAELK